LAKDTILALRIINDATSPHSNYFRELSKPGPRDFLHYLFVRNLLSFRRFCDARIKGAEKASYIRRSTITSKDDRAKDPWAWLIFTFIPWYCINWITPGKWDWLFLSFT